MAGMVWTYDATEDLINLRNEYREEFENALNTEHAVIWDGIVTEITIFIQLKLLADNA
ncbi:10427_t:CDS:1, partial [Funneliformis geosporum]